MEFTLSGLTLPVRILPPRPMTDEEMMQFCEQNRPLPIERDAEGYLVVMSPSGSESAARNAEIGFELVLWNRRCGAGTVLDSNGGVTLPDGSVRAADAAWISGGRWRALTAEQQGSYAPVCPEFVIELRSPSDSLPVLHEKMELWIRNGVEIAWLLDPAGKTVTVYRPGKAPECLDNISQVDGEGPVAGFILPLDRIFT